MREDKKDKDRNDDKSKDDDKKDRPIFVDFINESGKPKKQED